ncbi:MAG: serine hydrolase, partial [Acidimicrobiia bacterium]
EVDEDFEALWAEVPTYSIRGPGDVLPMFADRPMKFEPGGRFSYCNSGYLMLGLLIEQHSGQSWSEYTHDRVIAVSGMADSGFYPMDRVPSRTALNYLTDEDPDDPRTNIFTVPSFPQPDGGAFVTAPDMARLWDALASGALLKPATLDAMKHQHTPGYGYGLWIEEQGDRLIHHAEGGDPGVNFVSGVSFDTDTVVTVISNTDGGVAKIYRAIWEDLTG